MRVDRLFWRHIVSGAAIVTAPIGCGTRDSKPPPEPTAHVVGFDTYHAPIGTPIRVFGENFPRLGDDRLLMLQFRGEFEATDGHKLPVDTGLIEARVHEPEDPGVATWRSFGPFFNPLATMQPQATPEAVVGTFRGRVYAHTTRMTGEVLASDAVGTPMVFEVEPSIAVTALAPVGASCNGPARVGLSRVPYELGVQTLGFVAQSITYTLDGPPTTWGGTTERVSIQHSLDGVQTRDTVGHRGELVLPAVPYDRGATAARFTIEAVDTHGARHRLVFALEVHRPIEQVGDGELPQVSQREAPVAVSGCIDGGPSGLQVHYEESTVDVRAPLVDVQYANGGSMSFAATPPGPVMGPVAQRITVGQTAEWGTQYSGSNVVIITQTPSGFYWLRAFPDLDARETAVDPSMATTWDQPWIGTDAATNVIRTAWRPYGSFGSVLDDPTGRLWYANLRVWLTFALSTFNRRTAPIRGAVPSDWPGERPSSLSENRVASTQSNTLTSMERDSLAHRDVTNYERSRMDSATRATRARYAVATSAVTGASHDAFGRIPAHAHGVWYRQAITQITRTHLRAYNLCGEPTVIGEITGQSWTWNSELALTEPGAPCSADALPRPRLLEPASCAAESCR